MFSPVSPGLTHHERSSETSELLSIWMDVLSGPVAIIMTSPPGVASSAAARRSAPGASRSRWPEKDMLWVLISDR